jgi:hypothetical protein
MTRTKKNEPRSDIFKVPKLFVFNGFGALHTHEGSVIVRTVYISSSPPAVLHATVSIHNSTKP